jgi:hypothetical protein
MNVLLSGYQSIDMHCIGLPVKSDGGLSISVPRTKQLYKKMAVKSSHSQKVQNLNFSTPAIQKRMDHSLGKIPTFLERFFLQTE